MKSPNISNQSIGFINSMYAPVFTKKLAINVEIPPIANVEKNNRTTLRLFKMVPPKRSRISFTPFYHEVSFFSA